MALSIIRRVGIDRIAFNLSLKGKELHSLIRKNIWDLVSNKKKLSPFWKITFPKPITDDYLCLNFELHSKQIAFQLTLAREYEHRYFRLDLYPDKFSENEFEEIKKVVSLAIAPLDYDYLFKKGKVSYIEVYADFLSHPMHTFIPLRTHISDSQIIVENGIKGTLYLGAQKSDSRHAFYDKKKQLLEKKGLETPYAIWTRIEARLTHPGHKPCDLLMHLPNPFNKISIVDPIRARKISIDSEFHKLLDACEENGSGSAFRGYLPYEKKVFRQKLKTCLVWWWRPEKLWGHFPNALAKITP
ncbi:replication initiation factor domain-containing protein [Collimonas sp.]|jgi:hypothetical protein|uniref:replication initiation factor domain-containing protein n=1 Tax=Collimonas sp. TaxID=1963772 RepID=UPI002CED98A2|nr:replication initiation factor domain-containing protein [Collimonas sp.]HWW08139.1 replication initiation factor domain-containing protein [Collimonas sp.]